MRRTRRHKFLQISIFFLIYSIIHVLSEHSVNKTNPLKVAEDTLLKEPKEPVKVAEEELNKAEEEVKQKEEKPNEEKPKEEKPKEEKPKEEKTKEEKPKEDKPKEEKPKEEKPKEKPKKEKPTVEPKVVPTSTKSPEKREEKTTSAPMVTTDIPTTTTPGHGHPTWRPKRTNCTPPAIEQFPKPLMGPWGRKHGGLLLHVIVAMYTFLGLAIVCDEYFVASLDRICEELKLSPDVAGATFMAAGSSAPELATVIIGVFFAKDDIGVSGVIGSAVFNIMFVISVCALCTSTISYLNWWPLIRDCFFYALSILIMLSTIYNDTITWGESLFMLIMYVVYCIALHFNPLLEAWAHTLSLPFKLPTPEENAAIVSNYKALDEEKNKRASYGSPEGNIENVENADQGYGEMSGASLNQVQTNPVGTEPAEAVQQPPPPLIAPSYYRPKENNPNQPVVNPLEKPTEGTIMNLITWYVVFPIHYMCRKTMPDCKSEQYKNWYPFTFCVSMVWISFYSYFMVWMITIIGSTLGVPDTVMGLTFVAAGVSVPDALSSIAVIKEGYGDMAVSNAVGSNVFDILVCLGLPWFIQTAIIKPGSHVNVISKGLTYSTLSLLSTVLFLVVAVHMNGWKLDRKLGVVLMVWYLIFIIFASMYELNVFGPLNPPECPSLY